MAPLTLLAGEPDPADGEASLEVVAEAAVKVAADASSGENAGAAAGVCSFQYLPYFLGGIKNGLRCLLANVEAK